MKQQRQRGLSVASTLVLTVLVFTLALAVSGAALFHLNLTSRVAQESQAQSLAESAIAKVVERVLEQEARTGLLDFGQDQSQTVKVKLGTNPEDFGLATFETSSAEASHWSLPPSLNNLQSDSAIAASNGTVVPRESLYVAAVGVAGGAVRRVEAVVYLPRFPYTVATRGAFDGSDILIAGIEEDVEVRPGRAIPREELVAAHLVSNSKAGSQAVEILGASRIKGDLRSSSGANVSLSSTVDGELLLYSKPAEIPKIDLTKYKPKDPFLGLLPVEKNLHLERPAYFEAKDDPMVIVDGLFLDGGFLYVKGDLQIRGGIRGKGAVIATGDLTVEGAAGVTTDNLAAIMAGGDLTLAGLNGSPEDSVVHGLVYAGGKATVQNLTLIGVMLATGQERSSVENSILLYRNSAGTIQILGIDTSTANDPRTWKNVEFNLSTERVEGALNYRAGGGQTFDFSLVESDLERESHGLEDRDAGIVSEALSELPQKKDSKGDGLEHPGWKGYIVVNPVSEVQNRVVVTSHTAPRTVATSDSSKTLLSIDLSEFVSPLERMRIRLWRNL